MVQPDDILISPREVDEHFGTMVCFHPRYALGDHHNYMDKDDFLREMYLDTVGPVSYTHLVLPFRNLIRGIRKSPAFQSIFFVKLHFSPFFQADRGLNHLCVRY